MSQKIAMDAQAEKAVLTCLFDNKENIHELSGLLKPEHFYEPANETIYATILKLHQEGKPFEPVIVAAELKRANSFNAVGGLPYFQELIKPDGVTAYATDALGYAQIVMENARLRDLEKVSKQIAQVASVGSGFTAQAATLVAESAIFNITNGESASRNIYEVKDLFDPALAEIVEAEKRPANAMAGIPSGFVDLDEKTSGFHGGQFIIIAARPGIGKALALDTKVPTPTGYTTIGDINVSDRVFGLDGKPVEVVAINETMSDRPCYKVDFWNESVIADENHLWRVINNGLTITLTTKDLYNFMSSNPNVILELPQVKPVEFDNSVDLDSEEIINLVWQFRDSKPLANSDIILTASIASRVEFIQKLEDFLPQSKTSVFHNYHLKSAEQAWLIKRVCGSLGIRSRVKIDEQNQEFSLSFYNSSHYFIRGIEKTESEPVKCIQVSNDDGMFLITDDFLPTHNSTLAVDFARSACFLAGKTVLFFSLEMSKEELINRIIAAESRVELQKIRSGKLDDLDWMNVRSVEQKIKTGTFLIDASPKVDISYIRSTAVRQKQKPEGLDMIIIDYLQLVEMTSDNKMDNRQNKVSELSRSLKLLAKELDVPIITLSQLNRNSEARQDRVPQVSDLRESGSLEQDADMVLLIHRPEVGDENNRPGEVDLIIGKQRSGPTGKIPLTALLEYSKFVNGTGTYPAEGDTTSNPTTSVNKPSDNLSGVSGVPW